MSALPEVMQFFGYPDLAGFDKENRELIYAMCDAGWTGRITSKRHWLGKAPDGKTQITVPSKNGNNRGLKNASSTFMRWVREHMPPEERDLFDKAKTETDPLIKGTLTESLVRKQGTRVAQEKDERIHKAIVDLIETEKIVIEPLIRPYLARKHSGKDGGTRYESQTTLERVWPDGQTDYQCAFPGCTWQSPSPKSVAMHYGQEHTRKGESEGAGEGPHHIDPEYTEPLTSRDYRPTQRLVDALADWIDTTDLTALTPQDLAVLFLTWAHERPDIEHVERPLIPLTDKQILDKVRMLVGQPDQSMELEALKTDLRILEDEVRRLREERTALRELLA
jgi:hypothetical protein